MSDLARSLVDAAAAAVGDTTCEHMRHFGQVDCDACVARAAAAAVLETLAAHCDPVSIGEGSTSQALLSNADLRRLAAEVKTGEDTA